MKNECLESFTKNVEELEATTSEIAFVLNQRHFIIYEACVCVHKASSCTKHLYYRFQNFLSSCTFVENTNDSNTIKIKRNHEQIKQNPLNEGY